MSALDDIIVAYQDAGGLRTALPLKARAELDALCATVEAQARQLEEARRLFTDTTWNDWYERINAWLAANAPKEKESNGN